MGSRTHVPDTSDLWRLTVEHSPVGMTLVSPEGDFLTANTALCDMLGYDPEVLATLTFQDITHPDDLASDLRLVERTLAGEINSYRLTKRYLRADGSILVGDLSVALLRDEDGAPIHFISQIADLTESYAFADRLSAAEAAVDEERRKAEAVYESVAVGLLLVDAAGNYEAYNRRHGDFLDLAFPEGHHGRSGQAGFVYDAEQHRLLSPDEFPCARAAAGEELEDVLVWFGEDPQSRRALSVSARPVHDRVGRLTGAALAYHDVTDVMRAIRVKDEFVASVSHELRTPLTSALAYLELLEGADLSADVREQVGAVRRNALRLSHLVADLLFSARATSGSLALDRYRVDLVTQVAEAIDSARVVATGAEVALTRDLPESLMVVADGFRLRQVADNLIANAIAYTDPGGHVDVALRGSDADVELVVTDDGEGIDDADVGQVFSRFFRGQNARRRHVPGTGLGLSIVHMIVEAHGGEVTIESTRGVGTTVRVTVPR